MGSPYAVTDSHARVTLGSGPRRRRRHTHRGRLVCLCLGTRRRPASVAQPPLRHQPNLRRETERPRAHRLRLPLRLPSTVERPLLSVSARRQHGRGAQG